MKRYISISCKEIDQIEMASFNVNDTVIKFMFAELPNDMKMLAFLAGELTNSAKYFSTFADVCGDDVSDCTKSFGPVLQNDWRPWVC